MTKLNLPIVFIRGKSAIYHLLAPFDSTVGWAEEVKDKFATMACGFAMPKNEAHQNIIKDLTNLRLCERCLKMSELQDPEWAREIKQKIKEFNLEDVKGEA